MSPTLEPIPRGGLRQAVVRQFLMRLLRGEFPPGQRLVLQDLASRLGVSITPVREALMDLAAMDMVHFESNRGAVAQPFGPKQLDEIYQLRRILESEAARSAAGRIPLDELREISAQLRRLEADDRAESSDAAPELDLRLHALIAEHCGSRRLAAEIGRYNLLMHAIREVVGNRHQAQLHAVRDHLKIIEALIDRDADAAAAAMARHIDQTAQDVSAVMFPSPPSPPSPLSRPAAAEPQPEVAHAS